MNEPFVNGSNAQNQWSHDQLSFKRQRDMEPGYKIGVTVEKPVKTEEEVKREREDLWCQVSAEVDDVNINLLIIKPHCQPLFGLEIVERRSVSV